MKKTHTTALTTLVYSLGIGIFFTTFLWNIWTHGINVIGINFIIFCLLILGFYILVQQEKLSKKSIIWLFPVLLIIMGLGIYSTPFTGVISLVLLPIIFFIFTTHESHSNLRQIIWSKLAPFTLLNLAVLLLGSIFEAPAQLRSNIPSGPSLKKKNLSAITFQVILGLSLLLLVSIVIIIPLLSSADTAFANVFKDFTIYIKQLLANLETLPLRLLVIIITASILIGFAHYWNRRIRPFFKTIGSGRTEKNSIAIGIFLFGVLGLYLLFIGIQIHTLFSNQLPIDFSTTESLVKSGFWQLFALTILNTLFYVSTFRKSTVVVQRILAVFTLASLLLIASAAQRVFLYVTTYGLSYEKFFAFYTVVFCSVTFIWFLSLLLYPTDKPVRIVKTLAFLALWMYALTTIIPLERFIFNTNLSLTQQEDSRVDINELKMLGSDALNIVEENYDLLLAESRNDYLLAKSIDSMSILQRENYTTSDQEKDLNNNVNNRWKEWIQHQQDKKGILRTRYFENCEQVPAGYTNCMCQEAEDNQISNRRPCRAIKYKKWYENTFVELFYKPLTIDFKSKEFPINDSELKTFRDSVHGISVEYSDELALNYDDDVDLDRLKNSEDWKIIFTDGNDSLYIVFNKKNRFSKNSTAEFNKVDEFLQEVRRNQNFKRSHTFKLTSLPKTTSYGYTVHWKSDKDKYEYRLLIDAPRGAIIVYSNKRYPLSIFVDQLTTAQYIEKITPSEKLQDVLKSLKLIPVKNS